MTTMITSIRLMLALLWLRFCRFVIYYTSTYAIKPTSQFFHKVVIIGDDFAAGLGDYVTLGSRGGLAEHLTPLIRRSDKVRHGWEILNAGVPGSTTGDWLINSPTKYFANVFSNKRMGDAEIVIIILGSNEFKNDSTKTQEIQKNLIEICDTLRKKGKQVCMATIASPSPLEQEAEKIPLNSMLEEFCKSTKGGDSPAALGPRLDNYAFRRDSSLAFDGFHLNSNAYKQMARNTVNFLIPMMTAVEWCTWKKQLNDVKYDKSLYE